MTRRDLIAFAPALLLTGCSSAPVAKKEPEKAVEPVTGLHALFQMYTSARVWAQDLKILHLASIDIAEVKRQPGKAPAWQVVFVSQALGKSRAYTFSVYQASVTLRAGIFPEKEQNWTGDGRPFLIDAAKVDTDTAWATALKKGEKYDKEHPNTPISYTLDMNNEVNDPAWRIIWGESAGTSAFSVVVDASTGQFLQVLH